MLELAHPWLLLLLPLPLFVVWLTPAYRRRQQSIRAPFFAQLTRALGAEPSRGAVVLRRNVAQWVLMPLVWSLLVLAIARPQRVGEPIVKIESARDLMLVVDLSTSMTTEDFLDENGARVDRLTAVRGVLADFVAARSTDRLGLIVFGQAAFLQVPFTLDHDVFLQLLDEVEIGMAGPRTMLGDAIGLAIRAFEASEAKDKVAILLTDGNDTGSKVPPAKAAAIAERAGITLYTIGVGDPGAAGEAPLDVDTLRSIAEATGGRFFRAGDRAALADTYRSLDALEPLDYETQSYRPTFELYFWPLGAAVALWLGYHLVAATLAAAARRREVADA
jgi:Ca-activated chloride channel family protein